MIMQLFLIRLFSFNVSIPWPLGAFDNRRSLKSIDNLCFVIDRLISENRISVTFCCLAYMGWILFWPSCTESCWKSLFSNLIVSICIN